MEKIHQVLWFSPPPLIYRRRYLVRDEVLDASGEAEIAFDVVTERGFADRDLHRARLEHAAWPGIGEAIKVKAGKIVRFKAAPNLKAAV